MKQNKSRYYVISQRLTSLAFGMVIGYLIAQNEGSTGFAFLAVFAFLALIAGSYFGWKARKG